MRRTARCCKRADPKRRLHRFQHVGADWFRSDLVDRLIRILVLRCENCGLRIQVKTHVERRKCG